MMQRRLFLIGASALALPACSSDLLGPPEAGAIYPVNPSFAAGQGQKVGWDLSIMRPDVAGGLDNDRIALHQPGGVLDFYAKATYPAPLPALIQQAFLDGFEASGRIDGVAPEQATLHADYNLVTDVKDFSAHYSQQDGIPLVTVSITAKLITAHGRVIVSTLAVSKNGTASVNSAAATVQALQQALGAAVTDIVDWALKAPMPKSQQPTIGSPVDSAQQLLRDTNRGLGR
ncbi:MAG: ABC-type transport auxiliary lipoprotein family protein [Rhizomicrobium sp.]